MSGRVSFAHRWDRHRRQQWKVQARRAQESKERTRSDIGVQRQVELERLVELHGQVPVRHRADRNLLEHRNLFAGLVDMHVAGHATAGADRPRSAQAQAEDRWLRYLQRHRT